MRERQTDRQWGTTSPPPKIKTHKMPTFAPHDELVKEV